MKTITMIAASLLIAAAAPAHATPPTIAEQGRAAIERIQAETRDALRANPAPTLAAHLLKTQFPLNATQIVVSYGRSGSATTGKQ